MKTQRTAALSPRSATIVAIVAAGAFLAASYVLYYSGVLETRRAMADDVAQLSQIFKTIDDTCGILGFDYDKNTIDFLNVKSFVGSEVGTMNLADPSKWQGPYLERNLVMQDKYYQIVRARDGYYIVPGDGVKLANGAHMGAELTITPETDVSVLLGPDSPLLYLDRLLIAPVQVGGILPPL